MRDPQALMSTADLASLLGQPRLRVYDCTTYLETPPPGSDDPYIAVPGRRTFEEAHIPGADFLDLQGEFSDQTTRLRFMMPPAAQLEAAFGRHGLGGDSRVVLYSVGTMMWATRFWWMLRSLGFDGSAVLEGGFDKWKAEGRPTEAGPARGYPAAAFKASPRPGFFVDKRAVLAATKEPGTVTDPQRCMAALRQQFERAWAGCAIDLVCHQRGSAGPDWQLRPAVGADGTLVVPEVPFGSYSLHAVAVDEAFVLIASGTVDVTDACAVVVAMRDELGARPPR
jgi:rhodanese-related sulfurtransferase